MEGRNGGERRRRVEWRKEGRRERKGNRNKQELEEE